MHQKDHIDQARGLREKTTLSIRSKWGPADSVPAAQSQFASCVRVIAISSGKGGVGKSNVVVNLAVALDRLGKRVFILDADLSLANIDILLGLTPKFNISHVLDGSKRLEEVLVKGPGNIRIMPACSGVQQLTKLTDEQKLFFLEMLDGLEDEIDVLLIDIAAGVSDSVLYFNMAAQEKVIVVTPEPTSLTDAYALIKILYTRHGERHFKILTNAVEDEAMGKSIFSKISKVADHFLDGLSLDYLGSIPHDPCVPKAVIQQKVLLEAYPQAEAARAFISLAKKMDRSPPQFNHGSIQFFWKQLLQV